MIATNFNPQDVTRRVLPAWFRSCAAHGGGADQPANTSGVIEHEGLHYVRLENARGVLAVYRIRDVNGAARLKRLKR